MKYFFVLALLLSLTVFGFAGCPCGLQQAGSDAVQVQAGSPGAVAEASNDVADVGNEESSQGMEAQVRMLVQEKKNGTLEVPQGQMVRIIAKNHVVSAGNQSLQLEEQLKVKLRVKNKTHVVGFNSTGEDEIEFGENGTKVRTRENLTIENSEMYAGKNNSKVLVMPSVVPEKVRMKTVNSAVLHLVGDTPVYDVNGTKGAKVLWIFDAEMEVQTRLNAQNGEIIRENRPWWSMLVTSEESE